MTDYINSGLVTLGDLESLDAKVAEVERLINDTNQQVSAKATSISSPAAAFEDGVSVEIVGGIISDLASVREQEPRQALVALDALNKKHPDLAVVQTLTDLYTQTIEKQAMQQFLEHAQQIEDDASGIAAEPTSQTVQALSDIFKRIHELPEVDASVSTQVTETLRSGALLKTEAVKQKLAAVLTEKLTSVKWLGPNFIPRSLTDKQIAELNVVVADSIRLQSIIAPPVYPDTWWALDILLAPVIERFNYHFTSKNKETNKLAKPEWAFTFIEDFLTKNLKYLELVVANGFAGIRPIMVYEVITSLLEPVRLKINSMVHTLNESITAFQDDSKNLDKSGRLLSHLIFEVSAFDQRLRNTYKYNPYLQRIDELPTKKWKGLTGDVLLGADDRERVASTNWLNFELRLATNRFKTEIINDANAMTIDADFKLDGQDASVKPTYSAYNLVKLFDNLTTHYKTMSIVKFQLKYASTIQLALLDQYLEFLKQQLKVYEDSVGSSVLNIIPGHADPQQQGSEASSALKSLEQLTRVFCSARYISQSLHAWSEELIFIQLWKSYTDASDKSYSQYSTIFDTSIANYEAFSKTVRRKYDDFFRNAIKTYLKAYVNTTQWDLDATKSNASYFGQLVTNVPVFFGYLRRAVSDLDYFMVADSAVQAICQLWHEYIITNNRFNKVGAEQLQTDFEFVLGQLASELLLSADSVYSTQSNVYYQKVHQSISVLLKFDSVMARNLSKHYEEKTIRHEFDHRLSALSNHEIKDVLLRIG